MINNKLKNISAVLALFMISSCSLFDLDVNTDPNNPSQAAPNLLLANIEIDLMTNLAANEGDASTYMGLMGTQALSRYDLANTSYIGLWNAMYTGPLKDVEGLIAASQSNPHYLGIAQVLKSIAYSTMVDLWGDVPFNEAAKGDAETKILNANFDDDAAIYNSCLTLLDDALANFAKPSAGTVSGDVIYNGNITKWTSAAKTMKLKLLTTARLAIPDANAKIAALIKAGGLISASADDFIFQYSKDPTSIRHPYYTGAYTGGEFDYTYICHELLVESLSDEDPRWPFYFRRQTDKVLNLDDPTDRNTAPCDGSGCTYGYVVKNPLMIEKLYTSKGKTFGANEEKFLAGIFGRDRGDGDGIPADGALRTLPGVYPCGGYFDVAKPALPAANAAPGGGIYPYLTGVNTSYYIIEGILISGAEGDAKAEFKKAIEGHINRVVNFGVATDGANAVKPTADAINAYVNKWLAKFDAATSAEGKLSVALKQLWFSSFGNGFESFNAFRRTGLPTDIQEHKDGTLRGFPLRLPYPQNELTLNPNAANFKDVAFDKEPVFWDK